MLWHALVATVVRNDQHSIRLGWSDFNPDGLWLQKNIASLKLTLRYG